MTLVVGTFFVLGNKTEAPDPAKEHISHTVFMFIRDRDTVQLFPSAAQASYKRPPALSH